MMKNSMKLACIREHLEHGHKKVICTYIVGLEVLHEVIPKELMDAPFYAGNRLIYV